MRTIYLLLSVVFSALFQFTWAQPGKLLHPDGKIVKGEGIDILSYPQSKMVMGVSGVDGSQALISEHNNNNYFLTAYFPGVVNAPSLDFPAGGDIPVQMALPGNRTLWLMYDDYFEVLNDSLQGVQSFRFQGFTAQEIIAGGDGRIYALIEETVGGKDILVAIDPATLSVDWAKEYYWGSGAHNLKFGTDGSLVISRSGFNKLDLNGNIIHRVNATGGGQLNYFPDGSFGVAGWDWVAMFDADGTFDWYGEFPHFSLPKSLYPNTNNPQLNTHPLPYYPTWMGLVIDPMTKSLGISYNEFYNDPNLCCQQPSLEYDFSYTVLFDSVHNHNPKVVIHQGFMGFDSIVSIQNGPNGEIVEAVHHQLHTTTIPAPCCAYHTYSPWLKTSFLNDAPSSSISGCYFGGDQIAHIPIPPTGKTKSSVLNTNFPAPLSRTLNWQVLPSLQYTYSLGPIVVTTCGCPPPTLQFNPVYEGSDSAGVAVSLNPYLYNYHNFEWDFGDGSTDTNWVTHHTYTSPGNYTITLRGSNLCDSASIQISIDVCDFAALESDSTTCLGDTLFFNSGSGPVDSVRWLVDSVLVSTDSSGFWVNSVPGIQTLQLAAFNGLCWDTTAQLISVPPAAPTTNFSFTSNQLTVQFQDSSSHFPSQWHWDFGDGDSSVAQNPTHTYLAGGSYSICLTAGNDCGLDTMCVNFSCQLPQVSFNHTSVGATITFQNTSTNALHYYWTFGDGDSSFVANPTHKYAQTGIYSACLYAINACDTVSLCQTLPVYNGNNPQNLNLKATYSGGSSFTPIDIGQSSQKEVYKLGDRGTGFAVSKYDPALAPLWDIGFTSSSGSIIARSMTMTTSNHFYVIGQIGSAGQWDGFVAKVNAQGSVVWARRYDCNANSYFHSLDISQNGDLIVGGKIVSGTKKWWVLRLDPSGGVIWDKNFSTPNNLPTYKVSGTFSMGNGEIMLGVEEDNGLYGYTLNSDGTGLQWTQFDSQGLSSGWKRTMTRTPNRRIWWAIEKNNWNANGDPILSVGFYDATTGNAGRKELRLQGDYIDQWNTVTDYYPTHLQDIVPTPQNGVVITGTTGGAYDPFSQYYTFTSSTFNFFVAGMNGSNNLQFFNVLNYSDQFTHPTGPYGSGLVAQKGNQTIRFAPAYYTDNCMLRSTAITHPNFYTNYQLTGNSLYFYPVPLSLQDSAFTQSSPISLSALPGTTPSVSYGCTSSTPTNITANFTGTYTPGSVALTNQSSNYNALVWSVNGAPAATSPNPTFTLPDCTDSVLVCLTAYNNTGSDTHCKYFSNQFPYADSVTALPLASCAVPDSFVLSVTITQGQPPYAFSFDSTAVDSSASAILPSSGVQSWAVRTGDGCIHYDSLFYPIIDSIAILDSAVASTGSNGELWATVTGGYPPFTYSIDGVNWQPSPGFSSLPSGPVVLLVQDLRGCIFTDSVLIGAIVHTGEAEESGPSLFPNPARDEVRFVCSNGSYHVHITNLHGQEMTAFDLDWQGYILPTSEWPAGPYLVRYRDTDGSIISETLLLE